MVKLFVLVYLYDSKFTEQKYRSYNTVFVIFLLFNFNKQEI